VGGREGGREGGVGREGGREGGGGVGMERDPDLSSPTQPRALARYCFQGVHRETFQALAVIQSAP
jgi:hypothetical protein